LLASDDDRRQRTDDLQGYFDKVSQFTPTDRGTDKARDIIVARNQLLLGELLAQDGRPDEAASHWCAASTLLQTLVAAGDLDALTIMATAQWRLGAGTEARILAQRIEQSAYRHPAYANLVQLLAAAAPPGK
jgi:ATP/maltotriose-dependent transcriptional regulator MalT